MAALGLAVVGGVAWVLFLRSEPEPVYQGKRLSAWLQLISDPDFRKRKGYIREAQLAVRHCGTNALPTLLRWLRAKDSPVTLELLTLAGKQHFITIHHLPAANRNQVAADAFELLGAEGKAAVPALVEIFDEKISPASRYYAAVSLAWFGPAAKAAGPSFARAAGETNMTGYYGMLLRHHAILSLASIHAEPGIAIPVLNAGLSDDDWQIRLDCISALGSFEDAAKPAVSNLFGLLRDPEPPVRQAAAIIIKRIDPEAAELRRAELDAALPPALR